MLQQHSLATTVYSAFMLSALYKRCSCKVKHTVIYKWFQWLKRLHDQAWKQMEVSESSLLGEVAILDSAFKKRECTQRVNIHYSLLQTHHVFVFPTFFFSECTQAHTHTHIHTHTRIFLSLSFFLIPLCCHNFAILRTKASFPFIPS